MAKCEELQLILGFVTYITRDHHSLSIVEILLLALPREDLFLHLKIGFIAASIFAQFEYNDEIDSVFTILKFCLDMQFLDQYLGALNCTLINLPVI